MVRRDAPYPRRPGRRHRARGAVLQHVEGPGWWRLKFPIAIRPVSPTDAAAWLQLRQALWPDGTGAEHREEIDRFFAGHARDPQAVLVAEDSVAHLIGVAELTIRP